MPPTNSPVSCWIHAICRGLRLIDLTYGANFRWSWLFRDTATIFTGWPPPPYWPNRLHLIRKLGKMHRTRCIRKSCIDRWASLKVASQVLPPIRSERADSRRIGSWWRWSQFLATVLSSKIEVPFCSTNSLLIIVRCFISQIWRLAYAPSLSLHLHDAFAGSHHSRLCSSFFIIVLVNQKDKRSATQRSELLGIKRWVLHRWWDSEHGVKKEADGKHEKFHFKRKQVGLHSVYMIFLRQTRPIDPSTHLQDNWH